MTIDNLTDFSLCLMIEEYHLRFVDNFVIRHSHIGEPEEMLRIKRNDTAPILRAELRNANCEPVFLTDKNPIKFILREHFYYTEDENCEELKVLESNNIVLSPQNSHRGRFQYLWQPGDTDKAGPYLAEFEVLLNGVENTVFGTYALTDGQTLLISLDQGAAQTITFNTADFVDIAAATADEIVTKINASLTGGVAVSTDEGNRILIQTNTLDSTGSVQVTGGTANATLEFDEELFPNRKISLPTPGLSVTIYEDLNAE
jgi:hypothetical protein